MHTKRKRRFYAFCGQFIGRILIVIIMNAVVVDCQVKLTHFYV